MSRARLIEPAVQLREPHEGDGFAPDGGPEVLGDVLPVEVPVLGVDDDPVEAEGDGHLGDGGRIERDPQAEGGPVGGECAAEGLDGGGLHGGWRDGDGPC